MVTKKTKTLQLERTASNSLFCIERRIQWLPGCPLSAVRRVCWRLTQCYSKTRKPSVTRCLFSWWARPCDVECCSSSTSIHPSIHVRFQWHKTQCQCWDWINVHTETCGHAEKESKLSTALCQHYTTAFSLCAFFALWAVLNHIWWLAVCGYKQKPHSCFSLGTTLKGYWLIHHSLNMDFFF